jgi:calnexin
LKTSLFFFPPVIRSDGVYHVVVDQKPFLKGDILEDLTPPIIPPKEIDDPEDEMPEDWDEREK